MRTQKASVRLPLFFTLLRSSNESSRTQTISCVWCFHCLHCQRADSVETAKGRLPQTVPDSDIKPPILLPAEFKTDVAFRAMRTHRIPKASWGEQSGRAPQHRADRIRSLWAVEPAGTLACRFDSPITIGTNFIITYILPKTIR